MQTLGIVDIVWRGRNLPVKHGAKFKLGGIKNNPVTYGRRVARSQEYEGSEVTATTNLEKGQSYRALYGDASEGELQVVCDTGQTFVIGDAFLTDIPEITGGEDGQMELKWMGSAPEEIIA